MTTVEAFAPAKINLTLHITGRRPDGYHELDSLVVFARDIGDRLWVTPADELSLSLSGPLTEGVPGDDSNLVMKAARLLQDHNGIQSGAHIRLEKYLPNGAGIGGGSSDAAAALKALAELWNCPPLPTDLALQLGADVPVCLAGPAPQRMRGIGEILSDVTPLPEAYVLLVNTGAHLPTGPIFRHFHEHYEFNMPMEPIPSAWDFEDFHVWLLGQINDLTKSASEFSSDIQTSLDALRKSGAVDADMSGSGSTCWGLFRTKDALDQAASQVRAAHPDWWVRPTAIAGAKS